MEKPDVKHLRAAEALAIERNFSLAAEKLKIGQSGLTKQIRALEDYFGFALFIRESHEVIPTPACELFIAEGRLAVEHLDRAIHLARAFIAKNEVILHVGKSPFTDPYLITKFLSLSLPLFPNLQVRWTSKLSPELARDVVCGTLDLAFLTGVQDTSRLTGVLVSDQPFYVAMLDTDRLANGKEVDGASLKHRSCILFERHVQPVLYDELTRLTSPATDPGCSLHHVMSAEEALHMVSRGLGVAVLTQSGAWRIMRKNITIRPLMAPGVRVCIRLAARSNNESKVVSDAVRTFVRTLDLPVPERQLKLRLAV